MPVSCSGIACKRADASERACFGMYFALRGFIVHAVIQCAIHTADGQSRVEGIEKLLVFIGIL